MTTGELVRSSGLRSRRAWVLVVAALAVAVTVTSARTAVTIGSGDFQWSAAEMLTRGVDAYQVALQGHGEAFVHQSFPNYLPLLFELLLPLAVLPFATAAAIWLVLNVGMYAAAAVLVGRGVGLARWGQAGLVALLLASGPAGVSLVNGQQTALVLLAAVIAARARRPLVAGAAAAVMLTKYSFAPVAIVQLLRRRRVATLGTAAAIEVVALLVYCLATGADLAGTLVAPLEVARGMARGAGDVHTLVRILTYSSALSLAAAALCAALAAWYARAGLTGPSWVQSLACGALIALGTFPHLQYDYAFLLPVLAAGLQLAGWRRHAVLGVVGIQWFGWLVGGLDVAQYQLAGVVENLALLGVALVAIAGDRRTRRGKAPVTASGHSLGSTTTTSW